MLKRLRGNLVMVRECFGMSIRNIMSNRVRSFLTVLGILIGVMAVITLITTVSGVTGTITDNFTSLGAGSLTVSVTGSDLKSGLSTEDLASLTELEEVDGVMPSASVRGRVSRGSHYEKSITARGVNYYFFRKNEDVMIRGRKLNVIDEDNMSYVCLIDQTMIDTFFFGIDPIGETLHVGGIPFSVVGVFDSAEAGTSIASMMSGTADILIPYTTAMKLNSANVVTTFTVYLHDGISSDDGETVLGNALDAMFSFEEDCYTITSMAAVQDMMETMMGMMTTLLAGIASIALLVGGIGIMNMMLTTVTERTTEIGLKKALGAVPWQIQLQFLIESIMLSILGGIIGSALGVLLSMVLCNIMGTDFRLNVGAIALGVSFSAAVGMLFGWAPARKASRLNPIDALRSM